MFIFNAEQTANVNANPGTAAKSSLLGILNDFNGATLPFAATMLG